MKCFIVNADDFGLTTGINEGIIKAFSEGIVTSTSLIAAGEAFTQAVDYIKENPALDVGVHLTLVGEKPLLPKESILTLVNDSGYLRPSAHVFFLDYLSGKISMDNVEKECRAQIEKLCDFGISITHIDSHQHVHMIPKILKMCVKLADEFGIKYIRNPRERIRLSSLLETFRFYRLLQQIALNLLCRYSHNLIKYYALSNFFGFYDGGNLNTQSLKRILSNQVQGISEIMCHPGSNTTNNSQRKYSQWKYSWETELECLTGEEIKKIIERENIKLISFSDVIAMS